MSAASPFARPEEATLHRALCHVERLRDGCIVQLFQVAQDQDRPIGVVQPVQRPLKVHPLVPAPLPTGPCRCQGTTVPFCACMRLIEHRGRAALLSAQRVERHVRGDLPEPRPNRLATFELMKPAVCTNEGVLRRILRRRRVAEQSETDRVHRVLMLEDERIKRAGVSSTRPLHLISFSRRDHPVHPWKYE